MSPLAITGLGVISCHGLGTEALIDGVTDRTAHDGQMEIADTDVSEALSGERTRTMNREARTLLATARLALADAGLEGFGGDRDGIVVSTCHAGLQDYADLYCAGVTEGPRAVSPTHGPQTGLNAPAAQLGIRLGAEGPNMTVCSGDVGGLDALVYATMTLETGAADVMLVCGVELPSHLLLPAHTPTTDNRDSGLTGGGRDCGATPLPTSDRKGTGLAASEAAVVVVLERESDARRRGAVPRVRLGAAASAFSPERQPADASRRSLISALELSSTPSDSLVAALIGAENAAEAIGVNSVLGSRVPICAPQGRTVNCGGATALIRTAIAALALERGMLPPTVSYALRGKELDPIAVHAGPQPISRGPVAVSACDGLGSAGSAILLPLVPYAPRRRVPGDATVSANAVDLYLDEQVRRGRGEETAFIAEEGTWTYDMLLEQVELRAELLHRIGIRRTDRILIVLRDSLEAVAFLLAAMRIGAVPAPIHTRLTEQEYRHICADSEPAAAVLGDEHLALMAGLRAATGLPPKILSVGDEWGAGERSAISVRRALSAVDQRRGAHALHTTDAALLQYTSGSTGAPKGVVHLHRGLTALPLGFPRRLHLSEGDLCFSTAKLPFGYGLGNSVLFPLSTGCATLLRAADSDPLGVLETIARARPTVLFAGPTLYRAMLIISHANPAAEHDLSSLRLCVSAGDSLSASIFEAWRRRFGIEILDGLGSTECLHIFAAGELGRLQAGSIGRAIDPYEVRLVDDQGEPVRRGEIGHLHVRGPACFDRYWGKPEETRATVSGGWVRTGDLLLEDEACLRYVGRSDDVFKVREQKVSPLEIEEHLNAQSAVSDSAVVCRMSRQAMPVICAFVCVADGHQASPALARDLRASLRRSLSAHKIPQVLEFVEKLPRTSTGKLERQVLRERAYDLRMSESAPEATADPPR